MKEGIMTAEAQARYQGDRGAVSARPAHPCPMESQWEEGE